MNRKNGKETAYCPISRTVELVGDACTFLIIRELVGGRKRFTALEQALEGASSRTLAKKLKILEERGIIRREVFREKPPRVEYSLTEKGAALDQIMDAMRAYGQEHL